MRDYCRDGGIIPSGVLGINTGRDFTMVREGRVTAGNVALGLTYPGVRSTSTPWNSRGVIFGVDVLLFGEEPAPKPAPGPTPEALWEELGRGYVLAQEEESYEEGMEILSRVKGTLASMGEDPFPSCPECGDPMWFDLEGGIEGDGPAWRCPNGDDLLEAWAVERARDWYGGMGHCHKCGGALHWYHEDGSSWGLCPGHDSEGDGEPEGEEEEEAASRVVSRRTREKRLLRLRRDLRASDNWTPNCRRRARAWTLAESRGARRALDKAVIEEGVSYYLEEEEEGGEGFGGWRSRLQARRMIAGAMIGARNGIEVVALDIARKEVTVETRDILNEILEDIQEAREASFREDLLAEGISALEDKAGALAREVRAILKEIDN